MSKATLSIAGMQLTVEANDHLWLTEQIAKVLEFGLTGKLPQQPTLLLCERNPAPLFTL